MPRALSRNDFRAKRRVLTRADFAYAPGAMPRPSDVIDQDIWHSIMTLPDDVAVRTSNYHGTALRNLWDLWGAWLKVFDQTAVPLRDVMLDVGDDFQAATFNAMTGYYRVAISSLRSALELTAIGTWGLMCSKQMEIDAWKRGRAVLSFGRACDGLLSATKVGRTPELADLLFKQKAERVEAGYARRIYEGLSNFSHSRPGHTDADFRQSNGPIYVRSAFDHVAWVAYEAIALCVVLTLLATPGMSLPEAMVRLLRDGERVKSKATREAASRLSPRVVLR